MKNVLALTLFIICFTAVAFGQDSRIYIYGKVTDSNGQGIAGAVVRELKDPTNGAVTNERGIFSISSKNRHVTLITSFIGFLPDTITVNSEKTRSDIKITLKENPYNLAEVNIFDKQFSVILGSERTMVLDYVVSGFIYALTQTGNKYAIQLVNPASEKVFDSVPLPGRGYEGLTVDCMENIHVLTDDSVEQLFYDFEHKKLVSIDRLLLKKYNEQIKPCRVSTSKELVYESGDSHYHLTMFRAVGKENHEVKTMYHILDTIAAIVTRSDLQRIIHYYNQITPSERNILELGVWTGNAWDFIKGNNNTYLFDLIAWYTSISAKIPPNFTFLTDSGIVIYDNTNNKLVRFDNSLELAYETDVEFLKNKKLEGIIALPGSSVGYIHTQKNGTSHLNEIMLAIGQLTGFDYKIKHHQFPQRVEVAEGKVFYLHRNGGLCKKLISQQLFDNGITQKSN